MAIYYLLDENSRGVLWHAIVRHNATSSQPMDIICVGDVDDLPLASTDPDILWRQTRDVSVKRGNGAPDSPAAPRFAAHFPPRVWRISPTLRCTAVASSSNPLVMKPARKSRA